MPSDLATHPKPGLVKAAGWLYLLIIVTSILAIVFIGGKYTVMGDSAASVGKMSQHVMLVQINCAYELLMFSAVIVLSVLLFEITRSINPALAQSAMLLRVCEALLGYLGVVLTLGVLSAVKEGGSSALFALVLYDLKEIVYRVLMVCIGLGTVLFFYLFYKAKYLPTFLPVWGIAGFGLILLASFMQVLNVPAAGMVNAAAAVTVILFELVVGIWLIAKGITSVRPT